MNKTAKTGWNPRLCNTSLWNCVFALTPQRAASSFLPLPLLILYIIVIIIAVVILNVVIIIVIVIIDFQYGCRTAQYVPRMT